MTREEYDKLLSRESETFRIGIGDLKDKSDRTLLWGYTCDRQSWHVYISGGDIHLYRYGHEEDEDLHEVGTQKPGDFVPGKRLYPEACDYEFCTLLAAHGVLLPFTNWNDSRTLKQYYGDLF